MGCEIQRTCFELLIIVLLLGHPRLLLLKKASWLNKEVGFERWGGHCITFKIMEHFRVCARPPHMGVIWICVHDAF